MSAYVSVYEKFGDEILDDVELYKRILNNDLNRFPPGFWEKPWSLESAGEITRYFINDVIKLNKEAIPNVTGKEFKEYKLNGTLRAVFSSNIFQAIDNAYPDNYHIWEFVRIDPNYWNEKTAKDAIKWLIEDKLKITKHADIVRITGKDFYSNNLNSLYVKYLNFDSFKAVDILYPNKYKKWEFILPKNYWNTDNAKEALKWLIEEKLEFRSCDDILSLTGDILIQNGFYTLWSEYLKCNIFEAIDLLYPNKFKQWEFTVPTGYWTEERGKEALKWLIEEKLKIDPLLLSRDIINTNRLSSMLHYCFENNLYIALEKTFNLKIEKNKLSKISNRLANKEKPSDEQSILILAKRYGYSGENSEEAIKYCKKKLPQSLLKEYSIL